MDKNISLYGFITKKALEVLYYKIITISVRTVTFQLDFPPGPRNLGSSRPLPGTDEQGKTDGYLKKFEEQKEKARNSSSGEDDDEEFDENAVGPRHCVYLFDSRVNF